MEKQNRIMKSFIVVVILLFGVELMGQSYNLPEKTFYENAKISLLNFDKFEVTNLRIISDSVEYFNVAENSLVRIPIKEVNYLRLQVGTHFVDYAMIGALGGGLSFMYTLMNSSPDAPGDVMGGIAIGFIGGGVLLGGLIGLGSPKWKTYYVNYGMGYIHKIEPDFFIGDNSIGLKLKFSYN